MIDPHASGHYRRAGLHIHDESLCHGNIKNLLEDLPSVKIILFHLRRNRYEAILRDLKMNYVRIAANRTVFHVLLIVTC